MKTFTATALLFLSCIFANAQNLVLNPSFEDDSTSDLSNWEWTCSAQSFNNAPTGGGNWCIKVFGGNFQGCFPGYAYQKFPSITNGQSFLLSGWTYAETAPPVGLYFGKINNGNITLQAGDTTSSLLWTQLSVQSSFSLTTGDTAVAVLYGGSATGPVQGYGYFDLINLQQATGINDIEQEQTINIYPNPIRSQTTLHTSTPLKNAILRVINCFGQTVMQMKNVSGQTITLLCDNLLNGIYFLQVENQHSLSQNKIVVNH